MRRANPNSMTKKQKAEAIPKLQEEIQGLANDLQRVESPISNDLLQKEIDKRKVLIEEYLKHIEDPTVRRRY